MQRGLFRSVTQFLLRTVWDGFSLGVDVTNMRGHRRYSNYKSAVDAAVSECRGQLASESRRRKPWILARGLIPSRLRCVQCLILQ